MKILALSKNAFDRMMYEKGVDDTNVEQQDKLVFISLNNNFEIATQEDEPYFSASKKNLKVMFFADVDKDQYVKRLDNNRKALAKAMTVAQAKELYGFIKDTVKVGKTEAVIIHCTMGVARSGAVASFIHDYLKGDWETFKRNNPQIQPNAHVYNLLRDQWYKDLDNQPKTSTDGKHV